MNQIKHCKLIYAIYTPFQMLKMLLMGVKLDGFVYCAGNVVVNRFKDTILSIGGKTRFMSKKWGNGMGINHPCMITVSEGASTEIGQKCSFSGVAIWSFKKIVIGNNVRAGANCLIMDGDGHFDDPRSGSPQPIVIEDNVWLGGNVVVMKGVTIGRNSLIGMNSVVTKDIPANCIAVGNPCKVIRYFDDAMIAEIEKYCK